MKKIKVLLLFIVSVSIFSLDRLATGTEPKKTYSNSQYGFSFQYPNNFIIKSRKVTYSIHKGALLTVSVFNKDNDDACLDFIVKDLKNLKFEGKGINSYKYDSETNEWRRVQDGDEQQKLTTFFIGPHKYPAYVSRNLMSDAYRDDMFLTNKSFALLIRYENCGANNLNEAMVDSLKFLNGTKPVEAKIVD